MEKDQNERYQHLCNMAKLKSENMETHMLLDLVLMLGMSGVELDKEMHRFYKRYMSAYDIEPGDECYYENSDSSDYNSRFIITRIYEGIDGLGNKVRYFDAIYHDGQTISDGALRLVNKTGNYYPIMTALRSPFDPQTDDCEETK